MGGRTETLSHTAVTSQIASFGQRDAKVVMLSAKRVSQEMRERFNFSAVINLNNLKNLTASHLRDTCMWHGLTYRGPSSRSSLAPTAVDAD